MSAAVTPTTTAVTTQLQSLNVNEELKFPMFKPTPNKQVHKLVQYFDEKTQTAIPFNPDKYFFCDAKLEPVGKIKNYRVLIMTIHNDGTVGPLYTKAPECFSFGLKPKTDQTDSTKLNGYGMGYVILNAKEAPTPQQLAYKSFLDGFTDFCRKHYENPEFLVTMGKEVGTIPLADLKAYNVKSKYDATTKKFTKMPPVLNAAMVVTKIYGEPTGEKNDKGEDIKKVVGFNIDTKFYHLNNYETTQTVQPNGTVRTVKKPVTYSDPKSELLNKLCKAVPVIKHEGIYTGSKTTIQQKATEVFVELRDNSIQTIAGLEEVTEDMVDPSAGFD